MSHYLRGGGVLKVNVTLPKGGGWKVNVTLPKGRG